MDGPAYFGPAGLGCLACQLRRLRGDGMPGLLTPLRLPSGIPIVSGSLIGGSYPQTHLVAGWRDHGPPGWRHAGTTGSRYHGVTGHNSVPCTPWLDGLPSVLAYNPPARQEWSGQPMWSATERQRLARSRLPQMNWRRCGARPPCGLAPSTEPNRSGSFRRRGQRTVTGHDWSERGLRGATQQ